MKKYITWFGRDLKLLPNFLNGVYLVFSACFIILMPKKIRKFKKAKGFKKARKKPREVLFKIKPLDYNPPTTLPSFGRAPRPKPTKIKKPSKPAKPLVKKIKPIKTVKPRKPKPRTKIPLVRGKLVKPPKLKEQIFKTRIKVIGIGGGGSSIVSEIAPNVKKAGFIVANTDLQALQETAKKARHFQFGKNLTHGLGTGMNPELGEQAAESEKGKIKELLKETDFCILVSCLGGGTGSGASPVFAKILRRLGILTFGIFTLPFEFEGGKRTQIAKDSLEKLKPNLNALVIIPNQKIFQIIDKNTPLKEAFSTINKALVESLEGLITLIYSPGLINIDFADLKTILTGRGNLAYLNTAKAKSPNQIEELAKRVLSNPLLPYSVQGAKEILFNIDGGLNLNMSQVEQVGKTISDSINPQARVAFGIARDKKEGVKITLLANSCKWKEWVKEKPEKKTKEETKKEWAETKKTSQPEPPQSSVEEKPIELKKPKRSKKPKKLESKEKVKIKVRQNALEIRKANQEEEKKMLDQERKFETPAFLRRKPSELEEEPGIPKD